MQFDLSQIVFLVKTKEIIKTDVDVDKVFCVAIGIVAAQLVLSARDVRVKFAKESSSSRSPTLRTAEGLRRASTSSFELLSVFTSHNTRSSSLTPSRSGVRLLDQGPTRQLTLYDIESDEVDCRLELTISSVKVWRRMIVEKHSDQGPVERTDRGHPRRQFYQLTKMT